MYCPFSSFKDLLGSPGVGAHSSRLLNVAAVDYILTILLALLVSWLTKFPLVLVTILMFFLGFACHILFGVNTELTKWLGINCTH